MDIRYERVSCQACSSLPQSRSEPRTKHPQRLLSSHSPPTLPVAAVAFALALNTVSDYKHKSWYVHYMVWIVPRMIYQYGDLWRFSTAAIESRNARLKRMGITCISWRPYQEGKSVYHYIDYRTGKEVHREQEYKSLSLIHI